MIARPGYSMADTLDNARAVLRFMAESLTGTRELPYTDNAHCGAFLVLAALDRDLIALGDRLRTVRAAWPPEGGDAA